MRLLVDDMDARAKNAHFAALAAHPNIEVRVFNPFASRNGTLSLVSEGARNFKRINRRMHNKTWIADNRLAIVGGRNLGDEYFGASDEVNFVDLDFGMVGPVVRDASASFDRYWNSPSAYPLELLDPDARRSGSAEKAARPPGRRLRASPKPAVMRRRCARIPRFNASIAGDWPMEWSGNYRFIADDPLKISMKKRDANRAAVSAVLLPAMRDAQSALDVISPYFVPGDKGSTGLVNTARAGKPGANPHELARRQRCRGGSRRLLALPQEAAQGRRAALGAEAARGKHTDKSLFGSSGASLHTKALSIDQKTLFVGSYNLDPRSTWLNCEQGVLVDSPALVTQFRAIFEAQTAGSHAWRVTREAGELRWADDQGVTSKEPQTTFSPAHAGLVRAGPEDRRPALNETRRPWDQGLISGELRVGYSLPTPRSLR